MCEKLQQRYDIKASPLHLACILHQLTTLSTTLPNNEAITTGFSPQSLMRAISILSTSWLLLFVASAWFLPAVSSSDTIYELDEDELQKILDESRGNRVAEEEQNDVGSESEDFISVLDTDHLDKDELEMLGSGSQGGDSAAAEVNYIDEQEDGEEMHSAFVTDIEIEEAYSNEHDTGYESKDIDAAQNYVYIESNDETNDISVEAASQKGYNPVGLQIWPDDDSFLQALDEGRLVLVILVAPWCNKGEEIGTYAKLAADMLEETYQSLSSPTATKSSGFPTVTKPLIGLMESTDAWVESFHPVTHFPALKFVLTFPNDNAAKNQNTKMDPDGDDETTEDDVQIWDFLGDRDSAKDIYDSVLMYWYRFVVSNAVSSQAEFASDKALSGENRPPIFTFSSHLQLTTFLESHGDQMMRPAKANRRHRSKLEEELFNLYMGGQHETSEVAGVFHPYEVLGEDGTILNDHCSFAKNDCDISTQFTQEIDPFLLLVQCRSNAEYGSVDLEGSEHVGEELMARLERHRKAKDDFDELAEEMSHRRDAAFFALNSTANNGNIMDLGTTKACDGLFHEIKGPVNGAVAYLRARRYVTYSIRDIQQDGQEKRNKNIWNRHRERIIHNVKTDWGDVKQVSPHAIFVPSGTDIPDEEKNIHGKGFVKDPATPKEYVESNLVPSTVVSLTPTVLWFDRDRVDSLAFPWYRKVHAVLFVDMALTYKVWQPNAPDNLNNKNLPPWPSSLNHSSETAQLLLNQQKAIQLFYNAAIRHRATRPNDDVVFLIVPSSEVRIMSTFGVDIWTPLDEALFGTTYQGEMSDEDVDVDENSNTENGYGTSIDNGESENILPIVMITDNSGRYGMQSSRYYLCSKDVLTPASTPFDDGGAMSEFINALFDGTIGKPFIRSETPQHASHDTNTRPDNRQKINKSNVTVLTGNSFESLVMNRKDEHTMLLITTYTCGHCKRFNIFWSEFSSLVEAMNWSGVINVMKIDTSKNDVPHSKINAWDLPAVYYFPAGEKHSPIEMTPVHKENSNPQHDYDEGLAWVTSGYDVIRWVVDQGKLDLDLLSRLDADAK